MNDMELWTRLALINNKVNDAFQDIMEDYIDTRYERLLEKTENPALTKAKFMLSETDNQGNRLFKEEDIMIVVLGMNAKELAVLYRYDGSWLLLSHEESISYLDYTIQISHFARFCNGELTNFSPFISLGDCQATA